MAVIARPRTHVRALGAPSPKWLLVPFAALIALAVGAIAVEGAYMTRAVPGLHVAGVPVGSLEAADAAQRLRAEIGAPWAAAQVRVQHDGRTWATTNGELGVVPDVETAASAAIAYGKTGTPLERARAWLAALTGEASLPLSARAQDDRAARFVASVATEIDRPVVEGAIRVGPEGLVVRQPVVGLKTDRAAALASLLAAQSAGDRNVPLPVTERYPALDASGFDPALRTALAITTPLEVRALDGLVLESAANLTHLLVIERVVAADGELPAIPEGAVAPEARYRLEVSLDDARVAEWVAAVGRILDRPARDATFALQADGELAVVPGVEGVRIDAERFLSAVRAELLERSSRTPRVLTPPFEVDRPAYTTEQAQAHLAQMAPIGTYTTHFPVNQARWANISTGARQFDGRVIAPGGSFSFWTLLGPVTVERGYRHSGAIVDGISQDDVIGGGLCQVSTTIFNVAARAGYQIDERYSHSYYIARYPLGLDAAVFMTPWSRSDLRWTNDTSYPVVIRSWSTATSVSFQLVTVPNGRTTTFSAPTVRNVTDVDPGQPADPAFPPGVAVQGRDTWVVRTVVEGGEVVHRDTFFSHYNPVWGGPAPEPESQ